MYFYYLTFYCLQDSTSDDSDLTSTEYVSSDAEMELYRNKTRTLESSSKKLQADNRALLEEITNLKDQVATLTEKFSKCSEMNMKLQERLLAQYSVSSEYNWL